jgi:hypothetical protein
MNPSNIPARVSFIQNVTFGCQIGFILVLESISFHDQVMKPWVCSLLLVLGAGSLHSEDILEKFAGTVSAVNVNADKSNCFTALDPSGKVKIFRISSIEHLEKGDKVIVTYRPSDKFPLISTRVKFLLPEADISSVDVNAAESPAPPAAVTPDPSAGS